MIKIDVPNLTKAGRPLKPLVTTPIMAARCKIRALVKGRHWFVRGAQLHLPEVSFFMPTRRAYRCEGYGGVKKEGFTRTCRAARSCSPYVEHTPSVLGA